MTSTTSCPMCGQPLPGGGPLCSQHHPVGPDAWAVTNRIMCDFFHRGIEPRRLDAHERADAVATHAADAA